MGIYTSTPFAILPNVSVHVRGLGQFFLFNKQKIVGNTSALESSSLNALGLRCIYTHILSQKMLKGCLQPPERHQRSAKMTVTLAPEDSCGKSLPRFMLPR